MSRPAPRRHTRRSLAAEMKYPGRNLWILLVANLAVRLALVPVNWAEYTDGVLQLIQFQHPTGIWPPLYTLLCWPFGEGLERLGLPLGAMWAGRIVSAVASAFGVWPIYRMGARAFGTRAAFLGALFYTVAPVSLRWAPRVMTDSLFCTLFWWACERLCFASDERDEPAARVALGLGTVLAVFAALARYQGVMLLPAALVVAWIMRRRFGKWPVGPMMWQFAFLSLPLWAWFGGFIHSNQVSERLGGLSFADKLRAVVSSAEAFTLLTPYFLTYPVTVGVLAGAFWTRPRRGSFIALLIPYVAAAILSAQSVFASFQERYLLPVYGLMWVVAGAGFFALYERTRFKWPRFFPWFLAVALLWSGVMATAVIVFQRQTFGDIRAASAYAAAHLPRGGAIFTNESYNPDIAANKVAFFARKDARFLSEDVLDGRTPIPDGSLVVLSTAYGAEQYLPYLRQRYQLTEETAFSSDILPLLPDVMAHSMTNQNPSAWIWRYEWQFFETRVFSVRARR